MHVNLLPSSFTLRRLVRKRLRQWGWVFGLLAFVAIVLNSNLLWRWWTKTRELHQALAAVVPIREVESKQIQLDTQIKEIKKRITQLSSVLSPDRTCSVLGVIAQGVRSANNAIQIQESQFSINANTSDASKVTRESRRGALAQTAVPIEKADVAVGLQYQLTLRGIAAEGDAINQFVQSIQQSQAFPSVELRSSQERIVSERLLQEFQLECISHE